jgi:hypothetical protein
MGQVTIYLDEDTAKLMEAAANSAGISKSKWVAELIRAKASQDWPAFVRELAGAWPDMPLAEEIRSGQRKDAKRERL